MIAVEQRSVDIHGNGLDGAQTHSLIGNGVLFYLDGAIHRASRLCILICLINYGNYLLFDYFDRTAILTLPNEDLSFRSHYYEEPIFKL